MAASLTLTEKHLLLKIARAALEATVRGLPLLPVDERALPERLLCPGSAFVTLMAGRTLRGCIGGLTAFQPLYADVCQRAGEVALNDFRFQPVTARELPRLEIEISVLSEPEPLAYHWPNELVQRLRPGVDGVILELGQQRATFLPQVWERVPDPARFLGLLCDKLGLPPDTWRRTRLEVFLYQVEKFTESEFKAEPGIDYAVPFRAD